MSKKTKSKKRYSYYLIGNSRIVPIPVGAADSEQFHSIFSNGVKGLTWSRPDFRGPDAYGKRVSRKRALQVVPNLP